MATTDIVLATIIIASVVVGFLWGAARSLLFMAAWLAAFLAAAHLKVALGSYLARQWIEFSPQFNEMAAFGIIFMGLMLIAPVAIYVGTHGDQAVARSQLVNDVTGALFAFATVILIIAGLMIVLRTFYLHEDATTRGGPEWTAQLYANLHASVIGGSIEERLVPLLGIVLRLLVPSSVREAME